MMMIEKKETNRVVTNTEEANMVNPILSFDIPSSVDFRMDAGDFSSTTAHVEPVSDAGRKLFAELFGAACSSVEMLKSGALDFCVYAERKGLRVSEA